MIEHIADLQSSIAACAACVRPGGLLIVGCPNAEGFLGTEHDNLLNMPPHHVTWWSPRSLQLLAGHVGMVIDEIIEEPLESQFRRAFMRPFWLNRMLRRGTAGKHFVFTGRGYRAARLAATVLARVTASWVSGFERASRATP